MGDREGDRDGERERDRQRKGVSKATIIFDLLMMA